MAVSITRWYTSDQEGVNNAVQAQLAIEIQNGNTDGSFQLTYGPNGGIPEGQYDCGRLWTTLELAESWVNYCQTIGYTCTFSEVRSHI